MLTDDIQTVLEEVREPVRQYSLKRSPGQLEVHVPAIPGHAPYYRHSMKRRQPELAQETECVSEWEVGGV